MIVDGFTIKDVFGFVGVVDIDVRAVQPGLISILGPNGSGKTGLMEIVSGVNYGKLPGRLDDPPVDYATSRASFMEYRWRSTLDDDSYFRALLTLDFDTRDTDGQLDQLLADGTKVPLNDGKVTTMRKAIADMGLPSFDLFINSNFAAQGRGDVFITMKKSKKKDLYAEFLGLANLLRMAKTAGVNAAKCEAMRDRLIALKRALSEDASDDRRIALDEQERAAGENRATAIAERAQLHERIQMLEARLATFQDTIAAYGAADLRVKMLSADLKTRQAEVESITVEQATSLARFIADTETATQERDAALTRLNARLEALGSDPNLVTTLADIDGKIEKNNQLRERGDAVRQAAARFEATSKHIATLRDQLDAQQSALTTNASLIRAVEAKIAALTPITQRRDRASSDAKLLTSVPCEGKSPYDNCQFLKNAWSGQAELQTLIEQLKPGAALAEQLAELTQAKANIEAAITDLRARIAADQKTLDANKEDAELLGFLDASEKRLKDLQDMRANAVATSQAAQQRARADLEQQIADVHGRFTTSTATLRARQDAADADRARRRDALTERLNTLVAELATAEADRAAVAEGNSAAATAQTELDAVRINAEDALRRITLATATIDEVARARTTYEQKRRQLDAVTAIHDQVQAALVEWSSLQADLGKGGLVDLEIDSSVDTITSHANQMLMSCYGARFSMRMITQSEKVDGGMKDDFDVEAIDNTDVKGWRPIRTFSGGQRTIIQEALMLAIAIYVNERSPMPIRTLWRDETGGQLDETNARQYVEMLRKARELGQFHHIYFITHSRDCAAMADAQIVVGDGSAQLVLPPFESRDAGEIAEVAA